MTRASIVKACNDGTVAIVAGITVARITTMMLVDSHDRRQLDNGTKPALAQKGSQ